jgi:hypothetical protein
VLETDRKTQETTMNSKLSQASQHFSTAISLLKEAHNEASIQAIRNGTTVNAYAELAMRQCYSRAHELQQYIADVMFAAESDDRKDKTKSR